MVIQSNISKIVKDPALRRKATYDSHFLFFHVYFPHYIEYDTADFQKEMFQLTESHDKSLVIVAFRGSGKSTIMNMSLPLWSILGEPQCKYVIIVGLTQEQAKRHLKNIKQELENNKLLQKDLGPFKEIENEWSSYTIEIPNLGARITAVSIDQSIRGTRHGAHRPDLIICDDVEDLASVKTLEGRDKVDDAITSEIIPAGTKDTRLVVIGNLLHQDSFIMRLRKRIFSKEFDGIFKSYPLLDDSEKCLWPGKFPNEEAINKERQRIGKESSWQREYMLKIVTDQDQIIHREWIKYYDKLPSQKIKKPRFRKNITGIDLAISQHDRADFTSMVTAQIHGYKDEMMIYVLPSPINSRLTFNETLAAAKAIHDNENSHLIVEEVAYQQAAVQALHDDGCRVEGVKPKGDKRSRLSLISHYIQRGQVLFPQQGCERLIRQLINFGSERHDDLVDALTLLITHAAQEQGIPFLMMWMHQNGTIETVYEDRTEYEFNGKKTVIPHDNY